MNYWKTFGTRFAAIAAMLIGTQSNAELQVKLAVNKQQFVAGEVIVVRVELHNQADQVFEFASGAMAWDEDLGFSLLIAQGQDSAWDIMDRLKGRFPVSRVRSGMDETFRDRNSTPKRLQAQEKITRTEIMVLQPGSYRLCAVFKDTGNARYLSNEITFEVKPVEANDSIAALGDSKFAWQIGYNIFDAYYDQGFGQGLMPEKFAEACGKILEHHANSAFYPYALYALVKQRLFVKRSPSPSDDELNQALAAGQRFLAAYPDSWLVPEVGITICSTLLQRGHTEAALAAGRQALAADPNNIYLRRIGFAERLRKIEATIRDIPPVIAIAGSNPVTIECATAYTDAGATAIDDRDGNLTSRIVVSNTVNAASIGQYAVRYTVTDFGTNTATATRTVNVVDRTPPQITCPGNLTVGCDVRLETPVAFNVTATDACCATNVSVTCLPVSGSGFKVGVKSVTATAVDASGNTNTCTFLVTREPLGFTGFLAPIGGADATGGNYANPVRTFKLGSTIPVKFQISCGGTAVKAGIHTLQVIKYNNETTAAEPIDATPTDAATTGNQFKLTGDEWHLNLDTKATGMGVGTWQLKATLSDGSSHTVWIGLK